MLEKKCSKKVSHLSVHHIHSVANGGDTFLDTGSSDRGGIWNSAAILQVYEALVKCLAGFFFLQPCPQKGIVVDPGSPGRRHVTSVFHAHD